MLVNIPGACFDMQGDLLNLAEEMKASLSIRDR